MKLIYFTNSYPYGFGELWKTRELIFLRHHFNSITVVPMEYAGNRNAVPLIEGINYIEPLLGNFASEALSGVNKRHSVKCFIKYFAIALSELLYNPKILSSKKQVYKFLNGLCFIDTLWHNTSFKKIVSEVDEDTVLYFFWARGISEALPLIKQYKKIRKAVCRMHGYDLYWERNENYIPFQYEQVKCFDAILPCSEKGRRELASRYRHFSNKISTQRLGVDFIAKNTSPRDGTLKIVSCSHVIPLKRVHLIYQALQLLNIPVLWVHFGGGSLLNDLKATVASAREGLKIILKGQVSNEAILDFYKSEAVDLFINVSETEGVPVSIMEALSFGIPIVATDVGGTSEIIDAKVGFLLNKNFHTTDLIKILNNYYRFTPADIKNLREESTKRFFERCDNSKLNEQLLQQLSA